MKRRYLKTLMLLSLISLPWFVSPASVIGWGLEGHGVVAELADMRLTPQVRQEVATLLEGQSMSSVAGQTTSSTMGGQKQAIGTSLTLNLRTSPMIPPEIVKVPPKAIALLRNSLAPPRR